MSVPVPPPDLAPRPGIRCLSELDPDLLGDDVLVRIADTGGRIPVRTLQLETAGVQRNVEQALAEGGLGVLVVEGHLGVSWQCGDRAALEVCGAGDVIAPPDAAGSGCSYAGAELLSRTSTIALLDEAFLARAQGVPGLTLALARRQGERTVRLAGWLALMSHPHVGQRLRMAMRLLAERWGRVRPDGVLLPLPLTHRTLGQLVGSRRPTVTLALRDLAADGTLVRHDGGWLLAHEASLPEAPSRPA